MSLFFQNNTELPIVLETWMRANDEMSKVVETCVLPEEKVELTSLTGEWNIHRMVQEKEHINLWNDYLKKKYISIYLGKFRSQEAYNGECTWIDTSEFKLEKEDNLFIWEKNNIIKK